MLLKRVSDYSIKLPYSEKFCKIDKGVDDYSVKLPYSENAKLASMKRGVQLHPILCRIDCQCLGKGGVNCF